MSKGTKLQKSGIVWGKQQCLDKVQSTVWVPEQKKAGVFGQWITKCLFKILRPYLSTNGASRVQNFSINFYPSRIIRQKGKTNDKDKKCKEWNRGKKLTNVGQDKDNSIKGVDKKQTLGTVREWRRRRLWFQRVMPRSGCPLDAPDPHRRRQCLPAGISKETVTVTHSESAIF